MKVEIRIEHDSDLDCDGYYELSVDGKRQFGIGNSLSENSEDAVLFRDLKFVYIIPDLMKSAYEAGKRGEDFELVELKEGDE